MKPWNERASGALSAFVASAAAPPAAAGVSEPCGNSPGRSNGYVSWRRPLFVSVALADEAIAFEEVAADGIWTVTFATVVLGRFDERQHRIHPIAATSVGRSASSAGSAPNRTNKERR